MSFLQDILSDLRTKRLWPIAVALLAGIVAVPVLLSKTANSASGVPGAMAQGVKPAGVGDAPAISVGDALPHTKLSGRAHNPFAQQPVTSNGTSTTGTAGFSGTTPTGTSTGTTPTGIGTGTPTVSGSTGAVPTGGTGAAPTPNTVPTTATPPTTTTTPPTTTTTPPTTTTTPTGTSAPAGLTSTQSYDVTFALSNKSGGLDTINELERLSVLPSVKQPRLIELGVLEGGHRVLFVVQPGTVLSGPGTCTPGPLDCEILSLAQDQTENLAQRKSNGVVSIASFAVTAMTAVDHSSAAAANKARREESAVGRDLLSTSTLSALSLFQYEPSLGVVVDERNLTVGGG